jgi:hypothetical protein
VGTTPPLRLGTVVVAPAAFAFAAAAFLALAFLAAALPVVGVPLSLAVFGEVRSALSPLDPPPQAASPTTSTAAPMADAILDQR